MLNPPRSHDDPRWKFLHGVYISNSIRDSITTRTGRPVYAARPTVEQSTTLWVSLESLLLNIANAYAIGVSEEQHIKNIGELRSQLSSKCGSFLNENRITFGVAQKALNSYLKYLWCDCLIPFPPHCPFDSIIINKLKLPPDCEWRWTRGDEVAYRVWVEAAKEVAGAASAVISY